MLRSSRRWSSFLSQPLPRRKLLLVEELGPRVLPSGNPWPVAVVPVAATGANVTLDRAQALAPLSVGGQRGVTGTIGNGPATAADVAFYRFTLSQAAQVNLSTLDPASGQHLNATLSLYDTDNQDPLGYHLLAQNDSGTQSGTAAIGQALSAGTYYVGVSGSGNDYFNPFLVGSGYAGATGDYGLLVTATDAGVQSGDGPAVLAAAANATNGNAIAGTSIPVASFVPGTAVTVNATTTPVLTASPYLVRVELSDAIDPGTVTPDANVLLFTSATGDFTNPANFTQVYGVQVNFDGTAGGVNELQVTPLAPLTSGYYQVVLLGNAADAGGSPILDAYDANALGTNAANANGQDYSLTFQVNGSAGVVGATGPDDTPATARELGAVAGAGRQQITGVLGDDPTDPNGFNPGAVDLYHFQVKGAGSFAFAAEVFAGRIGSSLDPALTLFRQNLTTGHLDFVASNPNTTDPAADSQGIMWLTTDAALFAPLTAGDYYVAVTSGKNAPLDAATVGTGGVFDPAVSQSANPRSGNSTGPYVLNLEVQPATFAPHVVTTSLAPGASLNTPLTGLTVQFDRPVNIQQLTADWAVHFGNNATEAVFIQGAAGNHLFPSFESYDPATNQARFVFLDAVPNGSYTLHLSGSQGLTDFAGDALAGNDPLDPTADYVVPFTLAAPLRGRPGKPTTWVSQEPNNSLASPQVIGPLYPNEVRNAASIARTGGAATDTADYYQFTTLVQADYSLDVAQWQGSVPVLTVYANGQAVPLDLKRDGSFTASLGAGTYVLGVTWPAGSAAETYTITVASPQFQESATPLTSGPAPALSLSLVSNAPPPTNAPTVPGVPPPPAPLAPTPTPVPAGPVVLAPTPSAVVPIPPADTGGAATLTVAVIPPAALAPAPVADGPSAPAQHLAPIPALPVSAAGEVAVHVPAPVAPVAPGIPPQLALALSEGPVGGARGHLFAGDSSPAPAGTGAILALLSTPVLTPAAVTNGGDSGPGDPTVTTIELIPVLPSLRASGFAVPNVEWVLVQPIAVVQAFVNDGAAVVEAFDHWLAYQPVPSATLSDPSAAVADLVAIDAETVSMDAVVDAGEASPSLTESLASRPLWWGATVFIGFVWGGLNGQKWLNARRGRQLVLRSEEALA